MTENMNKLLLPLNLQVFAGDDDLIDFPEDGDDSADNLDVDADDSDDEAGDKKPSDDEDFAALDEDDYDDEPEPKKDEPEEKPEPDKKVQTPEENAKFAEERRQREQAKLQAELERMKQESPEFQLAQRLAKHYNTTPENMLEQIAEAELKKQAKEQNVPVEFLRKQQAENEATRAELAQLREVVVQQEFKTWQDRISSETAKLKTDYPMLTDEDFGAARTHMLQVLKNTSLPLEQVVFSLHGQKIAQGLKELAKQEALAEVSGRKKGSLVPPQGGKPSAKSTLTAAEAHVAKMMGMSEAEYLKYKT